jgi:LuxR family quorum-sensing system transcriptional regulator SolR
MDKFHPFGPHHFAREAQVGVSAICAPLFKKLNLTYFHYFNVQKNGTAFALYSRMDWCDYFYNNTFKPTIPLSKQQIQLEKHNICLWEGTLSEQLVSDARNLFNLEHPIGISAAYENHFESFCFGTHQGNDGIINSYLNNIDLLINFTNSFKDKAAELIKKSEENRYCLPESFKPPQLKLLNNLSHATPLIDCSYGPINVTKKEVEILRMLSRGLNIKEIAYSLNRSARTIDMHVSNLKFKLGCHRKSQLISIAIDNNIK